MNLIHYFYTIKEALSIIPYMAKKDSKGFIKSYYRNGKVSMNYCDGSRCDKCRCNL